MRFDCHMHTHLCGHAIGDPLEYVESAAKNGISLITFTCHTPMIGEDFAQTGIRMSPKLLEEYKRLIAQAAEHGQKIGVEVLMGIEGEVFPNEQDMENMLKLWGNTQFDFILGSLHHIVPAYRKWLIANNITERRAVIDTYFKHLAEGTKSGRYHSMSHPDVIRLYGTVEYFKPEEHEPAIREFLQAAVDSDTCIEVNTSGLTKGDYVVHPDPLIMEWAAEMGVKLTIGSDSHAPDQVGQHFDEVLSLLAQKGFSHLHYFKQGKRISVPLSELTPTN